MNLNKQYLIFFLLVNIVSCTKKKEEESTVPLTVTQRPVDCSGIETYTRPAYSKQSSATTIPYKITNKMYNMMTGLVESTPANIIQKIQKAFLLWESIPEANVKFTYAGLSTLDYYATIDDVPRDGSIYVVLNNDPSIFNSTNAAAYGGYAGTIPSDYQGGWVFMNMHQALANLTFPIVAHEIGHAIGLLHSVAPDSLMNCTVNAFDANDALGFNLQDRLNLMAKWPAPNAKLYSISGAAGTPYNKTQGIVVAVNSQNGEAYHFEVQDNAGTFKINVSRPGFYRVFYNEDPRALYSSTRTSSWYVSDGSSTTDPYGGSLIDVSDVSPDVTGINFTAIDSIPEFNVYNSAMGNLEFVNWNGFFHTLIKPGTSGTFQVASTGHFTIEWLESYGEKPDYEFTWYREAGFAPMVTVSACTGAPQGPRLVIAKGGKTVMAGLMGINIIGSTGPTMMQAHPLDSRQSGVNPNTIFKETQLDTNFDFSIFDENYWKN